MIQNVFKSSAPIPVKIIAWILLLGGILGCIDIIFANGPFSPLIGGMGKNKAILGSGGLALIQYVGVIVASFGIRYMRRWGLYIFTGLTVIGAIASIYSFIAIPNIKVIVFISWGIDALIMIYLWKISKMFK